MGDKILTTGINMLNGEYLKCKELVNSLKVWSNLKHPKYVKKKVFSTIKRECLRCYLYRYGSVYTNISIQILSEMFDLSPSRTKQFISKLIISAGHDSKFASLDELTECVVMHQSPPMPIQRTALEYSDKLSFLIEQNEKLLGIYSRYSSYGGSSSKQWNKNKGGKQQKDQKGDKKNKGKTKIINTKKTITKKAGRFMRGSNHSSSQRDQNDQRKGNKSQFGRTQNNRAYIRS